LIFWVAAIFLLLVSYGRPPLALAGFLVSEGSTILRGDHTLERVPSSLVVFAAYLAVWRRGDIVRLSYSTFSPVSRRTQMGDRLQSGRPILPWYVTKLTR